MNTTSPNAILAGISRAARRSGRGVFASVIVLALAAGFTGAIAGESSNVFRLWDRLPKDVRRVAVLPIAADGTGETADFGRESLQPVLVAELNKRGLFELVVVTPEQLTQWTGKSHWSAAEKLPAQLLEHLRDDLGCDAALFTRLSQYKPYPPLAMGWNLQLVMVDHSRICWAADEVFDMSERGVAASAQQYGRQQFERQDIRLNPNSFPLSPKQFGQYSLAALLATLPAR